MPLLRVEEIRKMSPEEREKKLKELRMELINLKSKAKAGGGLENPMAIRELRKAIARILTIQKEEQLQRIKGG